MNRRNLLLEEMKDLLDESQKIDYLVDKFDQKSLGIFVGGLIMTAALAAFSFAGHIWAMATLPYALGLAIAAGVAHYFIGARDLKLRKQLVASSGLSNKQERAKSASHYENGQQIVSYNSSNFKEEEINVFNSEYLVRNSDRRFKARDFILATPKILGILAVIGMAAVLIQLYITSNGLNIFIAFGLKMASSTIVGFVMGYWLLKDQLIELNKEFIDMTNHRKSLREGLHKDLFK